MAVASLEVKSQEAGTERPANPSAKPADKPTDNTEASKIEGRPEWLPDNFKNAEQFVESYKELQATLTKLRQGEAKPEVKSEAKPEVKSEAKPEVKPEEKPAGETEGEKKAETEKAETEVSKQLEADGVNVEEMTSYFAEHGDLTDDHKKVLTEALDAKFGNDKGAALLDDYLASKKMAMEYTKMRVYEPLGGEKQSESIIEWASKGGLNEAQAKAVNTLWGGDTIESQVEGSRLLRQLYDAANGRAPAVVLDGVTPNNSADVYGSIYELSNDQADPRYKTDPVYRKRVAEKAARSKF